MKVRLSRIMLFDHAEAIRPIDRRPSEREYSRAGAGGGGVGSLVLGMCQLASRMRKSVSFILQDKKHRSKQMAVGVARPASAASLPCEGAGLSPT